MIRSVEETRGAGVEATDGPIGEIHDIYFDDRQWIVRYYVIDTGKWLPGRKVLIPAHAILPSRAGHAGIPVDLTRSQVENSPEVDTDRPVSRQSETLVYQHYGWDPYWFPLVPAAATAAPVEGVLAAMPGESAGDPNLRSAREVTGYHVAATDEEIGHIEDFLVDDQTAKIRYAVVDTKNWLPGKKVLISPQWISEISWPDGKVFVKVTRDAVKNSPEYNPATPVDKVYADRLTKHYGYPGDWP